MNHSTKYHDTLESEVEYSRKVRLRRWTAAFGSSIVILELLAKY